MLRVFFLHGSRCKSKSHIVLFLTSRKPKEIIIKTWVGELMEIYYYERGNTVLAEGSHASLLCSNSLKESLSIWIAGFQPGMSMSSLVFCFGASVVF